MTFCDTNYITMVVLCPLTIPHALGLDEAERAITTQDAQTVRNGSSAIVARETST